jgi:hypothetical protein
MIGDLGLSRVAQIASQNRISAEDAADRRRMEGVNARIDAYESLTSVQRKLPILQKGYVNDLTTRVRLTPRIRIRAEAAENRLTSQVVNSLGREYSESGINGIINAISGSPEAQFAAMGMMNTSYNDLITQQREKRSRLGAVSEINQALGSVVVNRRGMDQGVYGQMQANTKEAQGLINELGSINAAISHKKIIGEDPRSGATSAIRDVAFAKTIPESDHAYKAAQDLIKAFENLKSMSDATSEEFKQLQKNLADASGGGGKLGKMAGLASPWLNAGAAMMGAMGNATMQIGVNQRLGQANNAGGFADWENQKYQTYKAAAGGDIASLMQLSQFGGAEAFGGNLSNNANIALSEKTASSVFGGLGNILSGAAKGAAIGTLVEPGGGTIVGGILGAISAASGDVANTTVTASDITRNVTGGQADIAARQAQLNVVRAAQAVGAEQVQGFSDFTKGMGLAARGAGSAGSSLLANTITDANLANMATARISPEQFAQMSQMGVASMGSMFNTDQIFAARGLEAHGHGTMQENMGRFATLSAAGSNNPQESFGSILETAMGKSLDNSKNLNSIAEHSAQMASGSIGRGIGLDTASSAGAMIMAGINKDTPNRDAALERSGDAQAALNAVSGNTSAGFMGYVNTATNQKLSGLKGAGNVFATGTDSATLIAMKGLKGEALARAERLAGWGNITAGPEAEKALAGTLEQHELSLIKGNNAAVTPSAAMVASISKKLKAAAAAGSNYTDALNSLSPAEQGAAGQVARASGLAPDIWASGIMGLEAKVPNGKGAAGEMKTFDANDPSQRAGIDKILTAGAAQLAEAAKTGATALGGATKGADALATAFDLLIKAMPKTEQEATTAAGKAAANRGAGGLDVSITNLGTAIGNLNTVLNNALGKNNMYPVDDKAAKKGLSH